MTDVVMAFAREMWWPHHESRTRDVALAALDAGCVGKVTVEFEDIVNIVSAAMGQAGEPVAWIDEAAPVTKVAWDKIAASLPEALEPMADDPLRSSLQGSFCVIESKGHPELGNRSYRMIFSFPTMAAMHAAHAAYIAGAAPLPTHQDLDAGAGQWGIDIVMDLDRRRVSVLARAGLLLSALIGKGEVGGQDPNELFAALIMALGIEEEAHGNDIGALRDVAAHPEEHLISDRLIDLATKRGKE